MKKLLFAFSLLLLANGFSQKLEVGPELGFNIIKVNEQDIGNNYQPGWHAGFNIEYSIFDLLSVKSGIFYTQKRQSYVDFDTSKFSLLNLAGIELDGIDMNTYSEISGRHTINFIQIPIMANLKWKSLNVFGGGYIGFKYSSLTKETQIDRTPFVSVIDLGGFDETGALSNFLPQDKVESFSERSNDPYLASIDYGFKMGVGYEADHFGVNMSYIYGLNDYRSFQGNREKQNNQYFQFSINYMIGMTSSVFKSKDYAR